MLGRSSRPPAARAAAAGARRAQRSGRAAPFALGLLLGDAPQGLLASMGALPAATADRGGPYRLRIQRVGLAVAAGALGFMIGGAVRGSALSTVLVVGAVAAFSSAVSARGGRSSAH